MKCDIKTGEQLLKNTMQNHSFAMLLIVMFVISSSIIIPASFAQTDETPLLFTQTENPFDYETPIEQGFLRHQLIDINFDALDSEKLDLVIFDNPITLTKDNVIIRDDYYTWFGSADNTAAVLLVDGNRANGYIDIGHKTYQIASFEDTSTHVLLDFDNSQLPDEREHSKAASILVPSSYEIEYRHETFEKFGQEFSYCFNTSPYYGNTLTENVICPEDRKYIEQLLDLYVGGADYTDKKITIDVYFAYTTKALNSLAIHPDDTIRIIVERANQAFENNGLPIQLNTVGSREAIGFNETESRLPLWSILSHIDDYDNDINGIMKDRLDKNADITVLVSTDAFCNPHAISLPHTVLHSVVKIHSNCFGKSPNFERGVGYILDADYFSHRSTFGEFFFNFTAFYIDGTTQFQTIMSPFCNVNPCIGKNIFSDPHRNFPGTNIPAGTENAWNAKMLFMTAPYIASLAGDKVTYEKISPTGNLTITPNTSESTHTIYAEFNESIHPNSSPKLEITSNGQTNTIPLDKLSYTEYTARLDTSDAVDTMEFSFINATDLFANDIVPTPTNIVYAQVDLPTNTDTIQNLNVTFTHNTALVTWDDDFTKYDVRILPVEDYISGEYEFGGYLPGEFITENSFSVNNLTPDTDYRIVVKPDDDENKQAMLDFTTLIAPPIENLLITPTDTTMEISWSPYAGASHYQMMITSTADEQFGQFGSYVHAVTRLLLVGLYPDTEYKITISSLNGTNAHSTQYVTTLQSDTDTPSIPVPPVTPTDPPVNTPDTVQNLNVTFTHNTALATWDDDYTNYLVRIFSDGYMAFDLSSDNSHNFKNLTPETDYKIVIVPDGKEDKKTTTEIRTLTLPTTSTSAPDTVQNLNVTFTHNTALATWDDDFTSYSVRIFNDGYMAFDLSSDNSHNFKNLTPDTVYSIVVVPDGDDDKKAIQTITTLSPPPIENLLVTPTDTSLDISWNPHDGATEYTVRVIEQPTGSSDRLEYTVSDTRKTVDNLNPDTEYRVVVLPKDTPQFKTAQHVNTLEATSTTDPPPVVPPVTPTDPPTNTDPPYTPQTIENLKATKTKDSFDITWDDNGASSYTVRVVEPGHFDDRTEFTTSDNSATVEDLKPQTQYKIIVAPENDFDYKQMITKTTKPAPVLQGLDVIVDGNFLDISWDDQPEVDKYMVRVIEQPDGYDERLELTTINSTTTVEDLKLSTEYRIVVLPDGYEQPKAAAHITTSSSARTTDPVVPPVTSTDPPINTPDTVQNLDVTFTHNTVSVTWDDDFTNYEVRVFPVGQYTPGEFITDNNYSVNNLTPDTDYRIVVVPDGEEDKKAAENITTLTEPPIENLLVTPTDTSLDISWNPHDGATEYTVRVIEQPTGTSDRLEYTVSDTSKTVDNLNPNTEYRVVVLPRDTPQSKTAQHMTTLPSTSSPTDPLVTPTDPPTSTPDTVQNLDVTFTHNTISATWDDDFANYEVRVFPVGQYTPGEFITINNYSVNNLTPDTDYRIVVVPDGAEDKKAAENITTLTEPPIENLLVTPTATSLDISWSPHDGATEYTVRVIEQPTGTSDRLEYTVDDTRKTVENLNPNTEYRVVVLPKDTPQSKTAQHVNTLEAASTSDPPPVVPPVTPTDPPTNPPDTVQNLNVTFTHNTISATWDDDFTNYEVRVFPVGQYTPGEFITDNNYSVNGLTPDTDYRIVVVPDGAEDKKAAENITTLIEPPIENLLVTPTATSLDISWSPHDGATEYTVRVIEQPTGSSDKLEYTVTDTSKTVDNLNPDTEYRVVVLPKDTPQSKTAQHMSTLPSTSPPVVPPVTPTDPPTSIPDTVQNLLVESTHNTIDLSWDAYENATQYTISVIEQPTGTSAILKYIVTDTSKTIYALKPDTEYKFVVIPDDMSEIKAEILTRTLAAPPTAPPVTPTDPPTSTPDTVQNLNVTFTHNTVSVTWDDDFTSYSVRIFNDGFLAFDRSNDNSHNFENLTPNTNYSIVVVPDGDESKKAAKEITTLSVPPIENLLITSTATSLDISWNPHDGTTEYTVRVVELPSSINDRLKYTVTDTSKTVDNLNPDTEYRVVVMPKDTPKARATQHITTLPSTPSPTDPPINTDMVQNLLVESTHNTIDLSWDAYENATQYTISVIEQPTGTSAILKYIVTDTSKTIYALKPDTEYKFIVTPDDMSEIKAEILTRTLATP